MPRTYAEMPPYYWITDGKRYYDGNLSFGRPVCDVDRDHACQFFDEEIEQDFPNGLPEGWQKERA